MLGMMGEMETRFQVFVSESYDLRMQESAGRQHSCSYPRQVSQNCHVPHVQ